MSCARDIRYELLARLCPNSTGADIRSVCTEAGMFSIRARRKVCFDCVTMVVLYNSRETVIVPHLRKDGCRFIEFPCSRPAFTTIVTLV